MTSSKGSTYIIASDAPAGSPSEKPCRACTDFRSWMSNQTKASPAATPGKVFHDEPAATTTQENNCNSDTKKGPEQGGESGSEAKGANQDAAIVHEDDTALWGDASKYGCPEDSASLGRGSWSLLHTMAAYYPIQPSSQQQKDMRDFIHLFAKFYPCPPCAEDFQKWIKKHKPAVDSQNSLSQWFCESHNYVNKKLGKPLFDCRLVNQRWKDGWADGSCD